MPHPAATVPRWHLHRRLYDWVLSFAHHKHSTLALFALAFTESSFFPVPPDVLQIAMTLERRSRAWLYAAVSTIGSVLGGVLGWAIGALLWGGLSGLFFKYVPGVTEANFRLVHDRFEASAFLAIFTAAFTPIPYKVFTIAAGVFDISLPVLVLASLVGRGARFFAVAAVFWLVGAPARRLVERYFNILTLLFGVALIGGFVVFGLISRRHADRGPGAEPAAASPSLPTPAASPEGP
jgi:membrane protein YqaA with SNARE-associated domain